MKKRILKRAVLAVFAALLVISSGCSFASPDDLYLLPQASEQYMQLQGLIENVIKSGASYSAPTSGSNRQAIQLEDLDGDGDREAIAFFTVPGADNPMKIYIYSSVDGIYELSAAIESTGSAIYSVNYADMDRDGVEELFVGWQISSGMQYMNVYSLRDFQVETLISTDYSEYTIADMTGDGTSDLIVMRSAGADAAGEVHMYELTDDREIVNTLCRMSVGVSAITRIRTGLLSDRSTALFIESTYNNGIITDVFSYRDSNLVNITADENTGVSEQTVRTYNVYSRDINSDGFSKSPCRSCFPRSRKQRITGR